LILVQVGACESQHRVDRPRTGSSECHSTPLLHFSIVDSLCLIAIHDDLARFKVLSGYQIEPIDRDLSAAAVLQEIVHFDNNMRAAPRAHMKRKYLREGCDFRAFEKKNTRAEIAFRPLIPS